MIIADRPIGPGQRPYTIAELGVNHDGSVERAAELIDAAGQAGASAIKLQYFNAFRLLGSDARLAAYQRHGGAADPVDLLEPLQLPLEDMTTLIDRAHAAGLHALVTLFSIEDVESADELEWDGYKVASPDLVNRPLVERLAATGRPLILSTGASSEDEIRRTIGWLEGRVVGLLQCVSCYPTTEETAQLGAIAALRAIAPGPVGYSDHTTAVDTGALAVAAGATILEKHLTWSTSAPGPDHAASIDGAQLKHYVAGADRAASMLGDGRKSVQACEQDVRLVSRQSLTLTRSRAAGTTLTRDDLTIRRPGTGLPPTALEETIGRTIACDLERGATLRQEDLV